MFEVICSFENRNNQRCPKCSSADVSKLIGSPIPIGTRDGFGIKNEFFDKESGIHVDTWKKWERAGYRNPLETIGEHNVREGIKRKIDKIKHEKERS